VRRVLLILLASVGLMAAEPAAPPDRPLADGRQETRARALFADIRCVVCQHESIADSPAGIAGDMRRLVREEIAAGRSDAAIREDLVRRYGDFVLFRPPVRPGTWLLWFGPLTLILLAGGGLVVAGRRRRPDVTPLSAEEEARLADLLQEPAVCPDPDASSPNHEHGGGPTIRA
jgi:cytochrome c-type biogenesis protein CcmH